MHGVFTYIQPMIDIYIIYIVNLFYYRGNMVCTKSIHKIIHTHIYMPITLR